MNKSTKSTKPAAPQVKKSAAKKSVGTKKAATTKVAAPVSTPPAAAAPTPVIQQTTVKKAVAKKTTAKKAATTKTTTPAKPVESKTVITAKIDIGFGNTLHLRGSGPGLSWDGGIPMNCVSDAEWSITLTGATAPVVFKFLVNDLNWSAGEDYVVEAGSTVVFEPSF